MARRPKQPTDAELIAPRKSPNIAATDRDDARKKVADLIASPSTAAARVIGAAEGRGGYGELLDIPELIETLRRQTEALRTGDIHCLESMLINQAIALQTLFSRLTERAMAAEFADPFELNMKMALRAQSQSRATLETLSAIRNPPVVYARQANIAAGPQQVNNGPVTRTREIENEQTQLSGAADELLPDTRASNVTGRADTALEAVGEIDGAKKRGRESKVRYSGI